jgi:uncharacterized protein (DUF58 family)
VLTGRGISLLTASVVAWLIGRTLGIPELYVVSVAAGVVVVLGLLYVRSTTSAVSARRHLDQVRVIAGTRLEGALELRNDAAIPSPTLLLSEQLPDGLRADGHPLGGRARFVVSGLAPGRVVSAPYRLLATRRGRMSVGPLEVRVRDPFGTAERTRRYTSTNEVVVYPRVEPLPAIAVRGAHMGAGSSDTRRVFATGEEFFTMREYVRGDDLRHVHWPSTAHRQTLMVRQMEQPWQAHATVYLDARTASHTSGDEGTGEQAVSIAASLVYHLADSGYQLRLSTDSTTGRHGPTPWEAAMDRLAVLRPSTAAGLGPSLAATRGGEGLFVAVIGVPPGAGQLTAHPDMRALFGVRGFGQRMAIVVAEPNAVARAERAAALLRGAGWRAATIQPGQPLSPVWASLLRPASRPSATATAL